MRLSEIFEKHAHWQDILTVAKKLQKAQHQVLLAGGCVRDGLLGIVPHDFDIATSATPDEVLKIFPKALRVGEQFGVIILPLKEGQIEVATFRFDGDYKDGRRPESVSYTKDPRLDAERRDFTVNALFYDLIDHKILDYVEGRTDLKKQVIRAVGDPSKRFNEDKLRILRAARFSAQLGFQIEEQTFKAAQQMANQVHQVSDERITEEFKKLAKTAHVQLGFQAIKDMGLFAQIWPELSFYQDPKCWQQFLKVVMLLNPVRSFELTVAAIEIMETLFRKQHQTHQELKIPLLLSREQKRQIHFLYNGFFILREGNEEAILYLNDDLGPLLTELCHNFSAVGHFSPQTLTEFIERFLKVANHEGFLPEPYLNGEDLKRLGVKPSPQMGELLKLSYMAQIRGEIKSKSDAQAWVLARIS